MTLTTPHPAASPGPHPAPAGPAPAAIDPLRDLVPLVIGVTGHRDLREEDVPRLKSIVEGYLAKLKDENRATPLVLLTSLAEGADRLVADAALAAGAHLIVPLPMPQEEYETDFQDPDSLAEFRRLLARAKRSFVVEHGPGDDRNLLYRRAGAYVARNCQVLIALWDGVESAKVGGTSEIVGFQLHGVPAELDPGHSRLDLPETGPVFHVITPRVSNPNPRGKLSAQEKLPPVSTSAAEASLAFRRLRELIDRYNRDVLALGPATAAQREKNRGYMLSAADETTLPAGLRAILERYAMADTLAQHFQHRTYRALRTILIAAFVVAAMFQFHINRRAAYPLSHNATNAWYARRVFPPLGRDALLAHGIPYPETLREWAVWIVHKEDIWLAAYDVPYLIGLFGLLWYFRRALASHDQEKYQDYRALAEGLRVQFYWRHAGLPDSAADHYLRKQKGELDWIRSAIRAGDILDGPSLDAGGVEDQKRRLHAVLSHWVDGQLLYFVGVALWTRTEGERSRFLGRAYSILEGPDFSEFQGRAQARREDWKGRRNKLLGRILLLWVFPTFAVARGFAPPANKVVILLVLASFLLFLNGVYARIRAFSEHAKQYARMGILFSNARRHLEALLKAEPADLDGARGLLKDLGEEALAESGDWVLLHRERPLELPRP